MCSAEGRRQCRPAAAASQFSQSPGFALTSQTTFWSSGRRQPEVKGRYVGCVGSKAGTMSCSPAAALGIGPNTRMRGAADAAQADSSLMLRLRAEGSALAQEADSRSPRVRHRSGGMAAVFNTGGHPSHGVGRLQWRAAGNVALRRADSGAAARWLPPSAHGRHALRPSGHPFRGRSRSFTVAPRGVE